MQLTPGSSLINTIAYVTYPMKRSTGKLDLPSSVETVVIDIGARGSDYLRTMEQIEDNSTAVFLFDPLPSSGMPLAEKTASYSNRNRSKKWLNKSFENRVFYT